MMKKINEAILDIRYRSTCLDAIKSKYMLAAQDLMITIFNAEKNRTPESEEEIKFYINELTRLKEELLIELDEFTDNVRLLDYELEKGD